MIWHWSSLTPKNVNNSIKKVLKLAIFVLIIISIYFFWKNWYIFEIYGNEHKLFWIREMSIALFVISQKKHFFSPLYFNLTLPSFDLLYSNIEDSWKFSNFQNLIFFHITNQDRFYGWKLRGISGPFF